MSAASVHLSAAAACVAKVGIADHWHACLEMRTLCATGTTNSQQRANEHRRLAAKLEGARGTTRRSSAKAQAKIRAANQTICSGGSK